MFEIIKDIRVRNFLRKNWLLIVFIVYAILPIDIIPEGILGPLGFVDDLGLLLFELIRRIFLASRERAQRLES